jgi:hypothetical protein
MARDFPYPPRMMKLDRAAHYCDLSLSEFERAVVLGKLPAPVEDLARTNRWCRKALDAALDLLTGGNKPIAANDDWRAASNLYGGSHASQAAVR